MSLLSLFLFFEILGNKTSQLKSGLTLPSWLRKSEADPRLDPALLLSESAFLHLKFPRLLEDQHI